MTGKHLVWLAIVGAVAAGGLVALELALPIDATWSVNRVLNYTWEGLLVLVAAGGVVWLLWPRPKAPRRDLDRQRGRRRVYALVVIFVVALLMGVFGEVRRDLYARHFLRDTATAPLQTIFQAVQRYADANNHARLESLEALVEKGYMDSASLLYAYRRGPVAVSAGDSAEDTQGPSFALAKDMVTAKKPSEMQTRWLAYLRPGYAWAPLTIAIDRDGNVEILSEDIVSRYYEWQFESRR
jgi:hypothetical protein